MDVRRDRLLFPKHYFEFIFSIVLQLLVFQPGVSQESIEGASFKTLMKDPYILLAAGKNNDFVFVKKLGFENCLGAISFGNIGIAMMEPSLPIWMMSTMRASEFQQG